ncbi:MAG: 1-acyl-sn-glycerol-3-phosphate acyltransferase [Porphyromonas sp.]|nr:1-acyl-sn-glycerol-3-phosphate acyltransferase [Porphyromonas sp.]
MKSKKNNIWTRILALFGWKTLLPDSSVVPPKSVICVAPHTSNWDFIIGYLYYLSTRRRRPYFMMKKEWFFFPLNFLFKALGGVPVDRSKKGSSVSSMVEEIKKHSHFYIGITPEGSRRSVRRWKTGFYRIAHLAEIPIELAKIDYKRKEVGIFASLIPTGDIEKELSLIRSHYTAAMAKYPDNFAMP